MNQYQQMGIRLTVEQQKGLDEIAQATGVEKAQVVRFAVDALMRHYERCGKRLILPVEFDSDPIEALRAAESPAKYRSAKGGK